MKLSLIKVAYWAGFLAGRRSTRRKIQGLPRRFRRFY